MGDQVARNESPNGWIVQKFGGTSVGKFPDKIAEDIIRYETCYTRPLVRLYETLLTSPSRHPSHRPYLEQHKIVVVCSARSTGKKVTGTTSR
jgi:aspartate kinase